MNAFFQQLLLDMVTVDFWQQMTPNALLLGTLHMLIVVNFLLFWTLIKGSKLPKILQEFPLTLLLPSKAKSLLFLVLYYLCLAFVLPSFAIAFLRP